MATFADRLRSLRKENNITQQELANKFFITKSAVSKYENGVNTPENKLLQELANYFNVSVDYLLGRSDNRKFTESFSPSDEQLQIKESLLNALIKEKNFNEKSLIKAFSIIEAFSKKGVNIDDISTDKINQAIDILSILSGSKKDQS